MNFECPSDATEESKIMGITSYRRHPLKSCFYFILSLVSCLIVPLVTRWSISFVVRVRYIPAKGKDSEVLVVTDAYGVQELVYIKRKPLYVSGQVSTFKTFDYRYQKYYYEESSDMFKPVPLPFSKTTCKEICSVLFNGISDEATFKQSLMNYGQNIITVQLKSNLMIFVDEILSPFYIFQVFSVILWVFFENYYIYAAIIFGTSTTTMVASVINIKKNLKAIKRQAEYVTKIKVRRPYAHHLEAKDFFDTISSTELVPGDVVEINPDEPFPCDLVLLSGSVVVDESMLTGESIPIFKEALDSCDKTFMINDFPKSILFAGTKCLDKKPSKKDNIVKGLVISTGFATTRAQMIKSFLFSPPDRFAASKDTFIFIGGLGLFAIIGFCASVSSMIDLGIEAREIVIKSLDLITTALPPALTTVLALGAEVSAKRLKLSNILSKSRSKINLAGKVEIMCFDKTGTLTEDSLKLKEVHFKTINQDNEIAMDRALDTEVGSSLPKLSPQMLYLMAACHSLTHIKNELRGDPLEVDMFRATQWSLAEKDQAYVVSSIGHSEPGASSPLINILKRFDFVPELQRMSVVVELDSDNSRLVYAKGSPEKLLVLCRKETVPSNIWTLISSNAKEGYRIVACASKKIQSTTEIQDDRAHYESDLEFLGLLSFENQLREASLKNIIDFRDAGLRTLMLTGDNPLTSIHAARSCNLIDINHDVILASLDKQSEPPTVSYQLVPHSEFVVTKEVSNKEKQNVEVEARSPLGEDETALPSFKDQQLFSPVEMNSDIIEEVKTGKLALAITGETLTFLQNNSSNEDLYQLFLKKGSIFSRMSPLQKAKVIEALMEQGHIVGMCGDGANDSAALKRAHVGLSIGNGEASLAAPFSTSIKDISSVNILLREGRAALCTSIQCFKYMAMYSVIQTTTMILLYLRRSNLTEWSFNYADILLNFPLAVGLSFSGPASKLSRSRPESKLISRSVLSSVIGLGVLQSLFQIVIGILVPRQDWYVHTNELHVNPSDHADYNLNYDSTCIFVFTTFQYITTAVIFSFGKPHRVPTFKNRVFVLFVLATSILSFFLLFADWSWIKVWMQHLIIPSAQFKWILFAIAVANSASSLIFEEVCIFLQKQRKKVVKNIYILP